MNEALEKYFKEHPKCALAFSGGCDSSFLLYAAKKCGCDVRAYFVKTQFQPKFEMDDALKLSYESENDMKLIKLDILDDQSVTENDEDRCYYCKRNIMQAVIRNAYNDGYEFVIDGTNASDDMTERKGAEALKELHIASPLKECGLTKEKIRELSREAGLFTADKPAYACLATRIPTGTKITDKLINKIDVSETFLRTIGLKDFRVRLKEDGSALLQFIEKEYPKALEEKEKITKELKKYFPDVIYDKNYRKSI